MRATTSFALSALALALGTYAHEGSSGFIQPLFRRNSTPASSNTSPASSGFDPNSPSAPPQCKSPCTTVFNAGQKCKDPECLCTSKNAKALGKCINCVVAAGKGSPFEGSFTQSMFFQICNSANITNLPTPTISLPPNFTLPPGVTTGPGGSFSFSSAQTANLTLSGSASFSGSGSISTLTPTATAPASSSSATSPAPVSSSSSSSSHSSSSASSVVSAAQAPAPTRNVAHQTAVIGDFIPMAVLGVALAVL